MKKFSILLSSVLTAALLAGCAGQASVSQDSGETSQTVPSGATTVSFADGSAAVDGSGAVWEDGVLTIGEAGEYWLSGELTGAILVDADENDAVELVLDGLSAQNPDDEVIRAKKAQSVTVTLADNTENTLVSGVQSDEAETQTAADSETGSDEEDASGAALWSKVPLTLAGSGTLTVSGWLNNGVQSKADLTIESGTITVSAAGNGVKAGGNLTVSGGSLTVESGGDALEAGGDLTVESGTFDLTAGGGAANAETRTGDFSMSGGQPGGSKADGMPSADSAQASDTTQTAQSAKADGVPSADSAQASDTTQTAQSAGSDSYDFSQMQQYGNFDRTDMANMGDWGDTDTDSVSTKGLKADGDILLRGGNFTVDACDDAIHSNADVTIDGGVFTLSSGDDGIHAGSVLTINGGTLNVAQCYEGLEGIQVLLNDGSISVHSDDDGVNAAGGASDMAMMGNFFGGGQTAGTETASGQTAEAETDSGEAAASAETDSDLESLLRVTGGTLTVTANGDGLDSNGSIYLEGGVITVSGQPSSANSAIDYGSESGGEFVVTGGELTATGYSGMAEAVGDGSTQCAALLTLDEVAEGGTTLTVADADGNVILSCTPENAYNSVTVSSAAFEVGKTYTLTAGDQTQTFTFDETILNQNGGKDGGMPSMGGGKDGGMPSMGGDKTDGMPSAGAADSSNG